MKSLITLALAIFRGFPWRKVPGYWLGQLFGAWLGAMLTYANYFHAIDIFEGGKGVRTVPGTASLFAVYSARSILGFSREFPRSPHLRIARIHAVCRLLL